MAAPVVWITGIPASGKSTIANLLREYYQRNNLPVDILDGDELRKTISKDLGFSPEDRKEHNRRVIIMAKLLSKNGITTIVPLISPYEQTRDMARKEIPNFVLVYVKASVEECEKEIQRACTRKLKQVRYKTSQDYNHHMKNQ